MAAQVTQQTREDVAQQLRRWATARNVSQEQTEQMVMAVRSGQYDAQIMQSRPSVQSPVATHLPSDIFANLNPVFGFQTPFGTFPVPTMPPLPIPAAPNLDPPPPTVVPDMFPTTSVQATSQPPNSQSTRTTFPGGEAIQQSSSYSGQQGNTTFQYSSSSTSMTFSPQVLPLTQPAPLPIRQAALPAITHSAPISAPPFVLAPVPQAQPQELQHPEPFVQHQTVQPSISLPIRAPVAEPEPVYNPVAAGQTPQNSRLAETFKQQLNEYTYFSDVPGMPDRTVQQ